MGQPHVQCLTRCIRGQARSYNGSVSFINPAADLGPRSRLAGEGSGSEMSMATDTPRSPASRPLQVEHFGLDQDQFL